jgi:hypothetical protein
MQIMQIAGMLVGCGLLGAAPEGHPARSIEIVAEAMSPPTGGSLTGQPLGLAAALGAPVNRRGQLEIAHAYWQLVQAVADYRFCREHARTIEQIKADSRQSASDLRESEQAAVRAQRRLAEWVRWPAGSLPLPVDRPWVVAYNTFYQEIFANRPPPEAARLAQRTLPLMRQAIDERSAAVQAATDALTAVADDHKTGRAQTAAVAACSRELLRQRRAFFQTVCGYNRTIADYSLTVVGLEKTPQELAVILIGPAPQPVRSGDRRAAVGDNAEALMATRPGWRSSAPKNEPTPAPWPPPDELKTDEPGSPSMPRTTRKPPTLAGSATSLLYPALATGSPALCAKHLSLALNDDRVLLEGLGKPLGLADCLTRDAGADRAATIAAYWLVCRRAAQYQLLLQEAELFEGLTPVVLERRNTPSGAADMLRLRAMQLAARADATDARVALVESQHALALRTGAAADSAWPLPTTLPHSGSYLLRLDLQPPSVRESAVVQRLAAAMPGLTDGLWRRATAVVDADAARVSAVEKYRTGDVGIVLLLDGVVDQTRQSEIFLGSLLEYNRAIAQYAIAVLPYGTSARDLVRSLVAKP